MVLRLVVGCLLKILSFYCFFMVKHAFLGVQHSFEEADVVIIPIAYDSTTSYGTGARFAPHCIVYASTQLEFFDRFRGNVGEQMKICTLDEFWPSKPPEKAVREIESLIKDIIGGGKRFVVLGGDHSVSIGVFNALPPLSILHIDAHADLRKEYEGTPYSHACALRHALDRHKVVQVGVRSLCEEEAQLMREGKVKTFFGDEWEAEEVVKCLGKDVYITLDVDALDFSFNATGTPEPGGISWRKMLHLVEKLKDKNVVGFDIVELSTSDLCSPAAYACAKLVFSMISAFWYGEKT